MASDDVASTLCHTLHRGDLVETTLAPAAAEAASGTLTDALEIPARAAKYLARLRDLKRHREALARALEAGDAAWSREGGGGRPGGHDDDDDQSEAASLASFGSGMSAYTDRTAGAATTMSGTSGGAGQMLSTGKILVPRYSCGSVSLSCQIWPATSYNTHLICVAQLQWHPMTWRAISARP